MTKYIRGDLSRAASYLYKTDYTNPIRHEIYKAIEGKSHDKCIIEYNFSPDVEKTIETILEQIKKKK